VSVRILIADDHKLFRDGLRDLLSRQQDLEVVAEAETGLQVLELTAARDVDLVIMDVSMPGLNGIDTTRKLMQRPQPPRVVMVSMHADRRFVTRALQAGAVGYLLKDCGFPELSRAVGEIMAGKIWLSPRINDTVIQDYIRMARGGDPGRTELLSLREREVLQLLAEGGSTKEIADRLCVSVKTVESHRKRIMDRLDLHSIAELTKYAIREGLTTLD